MKERRGIRGWRKEIRRVLGWIGGWGGLSGGLKEVGGEGRVG